MKSPKRIKDAYQNVITAGGVFSQLNNAYSSDTDLPVDATNASILDIEYHMNRSGRKICSPLVYELAFGEDKQTDYKTRISQIIYTLFSDKWKRLYEAITAEYNPIDNYNMIESETTSGTHSGTSTDGGTDRVVTDNDTTQERTNTGTTANAHTGTQTEAHTGTSADAHTGTVTDAKTGTNTDNLSIVEDRDETTGNTTSTTTEGIGTVSAYNVDTWSNDKKENGTASGTENGTHNTDVDRSEDRSISISENNTTTHADTQTRTDNLQDQTTYNDTQTQTDNRTENISGTNDTTQTTTYGKTNSTSGTESGTRRLERSGNIGVTTSAQMITQEIELRKWLLYREMFEDVDSILALSVW